MTLINYTVISEIQSFILLFILHYAFDMFCIICVLVLALYICSAYNNLAMFHLFQHVFICIWKFSVHNKNVDVR